MRSQKWGILVALGALLPLSLQPSEGRAQDPGPPAPAPASTPPAAQQDAEPALPPQPEPTEMPGSGDKTTVGPEVSGLGPQGTVEDDIDKSDRVPLPWSASLGWTQSYGVDGLLRSTNLTFNPTYAWDFAASVGYNFDRNTSLSLVQPLTIELTDSDSTVRRQQLLLNDTSIDLAHTFFRYSPREDQTLKLTASGRLQLPSSIASRAATMIAGTGARVEAKYVFDRVMKGLLTRVGVRYIERWMRSDTAQTETPFPCSTVGDDLFRNCTHLGGSSNTRHLLLLGLGANLVMSKRFTLAADISFGWNRASQLRRAEVPIASGGVVVVDDTSPSHWRNSRVIEVSLGYDLTRWFNATASVSNGFRELGPSGEYRPPFQPRDMSLGLSLTVVFDQLYLASRAHGGD